MQSKPKPPLVLESDGHKISKHPITSISPYNEGMAAAYKNRQDKEDYVYFGPDYRPEILDGHTIYGKRQGNNSAAYLIGNPTDPDCPGADLSSLIRAHGNHKGFKAIYEKAIPWKLILLGAAGLVIVLIIVQYVRTAL